MIWFQPCVGFAGFMLKIAMTPPLPSGQAEGACTPPGAARPKVEVAAVRDNELVAIGVVVAQQILAAARVAEVQQDVPVADRPEVRAGTVVADQPVPVVLEKRVQVFPAGQVFRAMQEFGADRLSARAPRSACRPSARSTSRRSSRCTDRRCCRAAADRPASAAESPPDRLPSPSSTTADRWRLRPSSRLRCRGRWRSLGLLPRRSNRKSTCPRDSGRWPAAGRASGSGRR